MAIRPVDAFPGKTAGVDAEYPDGKARNITTPGDATGTPWDVLCVNDLFGFEQALLADAGITPSGNPDKVGASQYLEAVKIAALKGEYVSASGAPNISIQGYLDRQGIWAEDRAGIQQANDYLAALGKRDIIRLKPRADIPITTGLVVNSSFVSLEGNGALLDASAMVSGQAIIVGPTTVPAQEQSGAELRNFSLLGPGSGSSVIGIVFSAGVSKPSRFNMVNLGIEGFSVGEFYAALEYLASAINCGVRGCGTGIQVLAGGTSNVVRFGGGLYENDVALRMANTEGDIVLVGSEIRDNDKVIDLTGGHIQLDGCRVEANDYATTPITVAGAGAGVDMVGGLLRLRTGSTPSFSKWVDVAADTFFNSRGTRFVNTKTLTSAFANGDGRVKIRDAQYDSPAENNLLLHLTRSMVSDGSFEESTIVDDVFITGDSAAITDRHTGADIGLTIESVIARSGTQSLRAAGSSSAGVASRFALACIPVGPFDVVAGIFYYDRLLSVTDDLVFNYSFISRGVNGDGVPTILRQNTVDSNTIVLPAPGSDTGWLLETFGDTLLAAPEWATHFIIEVDLTNATGGGGIHFDDLNVNILG